MIDFSALFPCAGVYLLHFLTTPIAPLRFLGKMVKHFKSMSSLFFLAVHLTNGPEAIRVPGIQQPGGQINLMTSHCLQSSWEEKHWTSILQIKTFEVLISVCANPDRAQDSLLEDMLGEVLRRGGKVQEAINVHEVAEGRQSLCRTQNE